MAQFRSSEMKLVQMFIQNEAAHDSVALLGELGLVQFRDLNSEKSAFQRSFVNQVKRCDDMERVLRFLRTEVVKARVPFCPMDSLIPTGAEPNFQDLEAELEDLEKLLKNYNTSQETLTRNLNQVVEQNQVLKKAGQFLGNDNQGESWGQEAEEDDRLQKSSLGFTAGVILTNKIHAFERVLYRATRGNSFIKHTPIEEKITDPASGEEVEKSVFVVFFHGTRSQTKINKLCDSFGASKYAFPESSAERGPMLMETETREADLHTVIDRTIAARLSSLRKLSANLPMWIAQVTREKAINHSLNLFDYDRNRKCLIAEGWTPTHSIGAVENALMRAKESSGSTVDSILNVLHTHETPPTHFETNKFTVAFQEIVDAYGIARYGEYNPAVFTCITFPFLFAVMFGDVGHGIIMTMVGVYLCANEKRLGIGKLNEMVQTLFDGRYVLLLMGVFAIYVGAIYNECFSVPFEFGNKSIWENSAHMNATEGHGLEKVIKPGQLGHPYPFGVDPGWAHTQNKLNFYNSLKMKTSIVFGVTQMLTGTLCKFTNTLHFKKRKDTFFEFIPEFLFMISLFGYLVFLIFLKWSTDYTTLCVYLAPGLADRAKEKVVTCCASLCAADSATFAGMAESNSTTLDFTSPAVLEAGYLFKQVPPMLLDTLIKMFMDVGNVSAEMQLFAGQGQIQLLLIAIAFVSVPILLLPKPCLLKAEAKAKAAAGEATDDGHGGEFNFGEVMVHQIIHTIEYVLGAVSNTASYLRLWALSLAHAQLSEVFWEKVMVENLEGTEAGTVKYAITLFVAIAIWAVLTMGVLMVMESLSAFLHALRLHWVEFQNKFYVGDGYKFLPFSYARLGQEEDE